MPKALCLTSLVVAILVVVLFLADLLLGVAGMQEMAPLRGASLLMDAVFVIVGGVMAYMSWLTYRQQV